MGGSLILELAMLDVREWIFELGLDERKKERILGKGKGCAFMGF